MPWNEPGEKGNNNNRDPWGNKRNQNPPDLDKLLGDFLRKLRGIIAGKKNTGGPSWPPSFTKEYGYGIGLVLGVMVVLWFLSGIFIVNPAEEAVILRFGKYATTLQPGLHW